MAIKKGHFDCQVTLQCSAMDRLRDGDKYCSIALSAGCLATPTDGDNYGVIGTDLRAIAAVDALCRPVRQGLAV